MAPVVVSPDIDSKKASVIDMEGLADKDNGSDPKIASTVQKSTTITNPSLILSSSWCFRVTNQKDRPVIIVIRKDSKKGISFPSLNRNDTIVGGNREMLKRVSSTPIILVITCGLIKTVALPAYI